MPFLRHITRRISVSEVQFWCRDGTIVLGRFKVSAMLAARVCKLTNCLNFNGSEKYIWICQQLLAVDGCAIGRQHKLEHAFTARVTGSEHAHLEAILAHRKSGAGYEDLFLYLVTLFSFLGLVNTTRRQELLKFL